MEKKKRKLKLPDYGIEYTFAINGETYKRVLIDSRNTKNGTIRLYFQDRQTDKVTDMSQLKFNQYLWNNQIIDRIKLENYVAPEPTQNHINDIWANVTSRIRSIPKVLNGNVKALIGYEPDKLAKEMDNLDTGGHTKEYEYRVMRNVNLVVNFLDKFDLETTSENTMRTVHQNDVENQNELIKHLASISPSMLQKCKSRFGYSIAELIDELKNLSNKDKKYIDSIYKEVDRVLDFVGYKKPVSA